jgi:hypothetical protein
LNAQRICICSNLASSLKPGGYVELSELATLPEPTNPDYPRPVHLYRWLEALSEASRRMGFSMRVAPTFKELVINAGFEDVVETKFEVPWGTWPESERQKTAGFWHLGLHSCELVSSRTLTSHRATQARPPRNCHGTFHSVVGLVFATG